MARHNHNMLTAGALFTLLLLLATTSSLKLPTYFKPCVRDDPKLNECALKYAREGIKAPGMQTGDPKYRIPPLEPMSVTQLNIEMGTLMISYHNVKMSGLSKTNLKAIRFNLTTQHNEFELEIPEFNVVANYVLKGKFANLPVAGEGVGKFYIKNLKAILVHDFDLAMKKTEGKRYMFVKNTTISAQPGMMTIEMDGLFNGNKPLGDVLIYTLNENWQDAYKELGGSAFVDAVGQISQQAFNGLMSSVPYDDIFPVTL